MFTTRPVLTGTVGMVASTHWLASASGMAALERGGNAFDAAVTAGFVLQVVEPHLNGPGGEVPILAWDARRGRVEVVCGQGPVPAAASVAGFRDLGLDLVPGTGLLAATVPGAFGAWLALLRDHGRLRLRDVLAPAISYAGAGFPLLARTADTLRTVEGLFRSEWPTSAATWLPDGSGVPAAGSRSTNPALAAAYDRLVSDAEAATPDRDGQIEAARAAFYSGWVAEAIDAHVRRPVHDASGARHAGVLTGDDLAGWTPPVEEPVTLDFAGWTVCKTAAWGQGPVFLQQLALLAGYELAALSAAERAHIVLECAKLAFADREAWYGDASPGGAADVPVTTLLSAAYADERRTLVGAEASRELRPGCPDGRSPRLAAALMAAAGRADAGLGGGEPTVDRSGVTRGDTCHVDVVDAEGNAVSATPSGGWLQSSPVVPELGFPLGTRAQMCWLEEGLPASLVGGRRPRTTLSPSLALRDGRPALAFGTPGGDQQDQWSLGFFLAHALLGLDLQAAIDAPVLHSTHMPSSFYPRGSTPAGVVAESRVDPAVLSDLRDRGHDVTVVDGWSQSRVSAAGFADGFLVAAANPRGMQGYAVGR